MFASGTILRVEGKQNSLFPVLPVIIKVFCYTSQLKNRTNYIRVSPYDFIAKS